MSGDRNSNSDRLSTDGLGQSTTTTCGVPRTSMTRSAMIRSAVSTRGVPAGQSAIDSHAAAAPAAPACARALRDRRRRRCSSSRPDPSRTSRRTVRAPAGPSRRRIPDSCRAHMSSRGVYFSAHARSSSAREWLNSVSETSVRADDEHAEPEPEKDLDVEAVHQRSFGRGAFVERVLVADAAHALDPLAAVRRRAQLAAQVADVRVDAAVEGRELAAEHRSAPARRAESRVRRRAAGGPADRTRRSSGRAVPGRAAPRARPCRRVTSPTTRRSPARRSSEASGRDRRRTASIRALSSRGLNGLAR